jgi:hypothetical protein
MHKQQTGCTASRINSLLTRNNEVIDFKCECGYEFQQTRLITQKVHKPHDVNEKLEATHSFKNFPRNWNEKY